MSLVRTRWAALGAAVAVTLGGGGIGLVTATSPSDATTLVAITPCRVIDTRPDFTVGSKASPLGPGETHTVATHGDNGDCTGIPADAVAVSMNVTAVEATAPTFLTIWATGEPRPTASSLNPSPGQPPTPNAVTTNLNAGGRFDIFNLAGNVHVLADINGYYVDHHHDDRYYTQDEVRDVAAVEVEVTAGIGLDGNFTSVPESTFALITETVTTDRTGYLQVTKFAQVGAQCSPVATAGRIYYITVDGIGLRSSLSYVSDAGVQTMTLHGVTDAPITPGDHEIGVGAECYGTNTAGGLSTVQISAASVVVLPSG